MMVLRKGARLFDSYPTTADLARQRIFLTRRLAVSCAATVKASLIRAEFSSPSCNVKPLPLRKACDAASSYKRCSGLSMSSCRLTDLIAGWSVCRKAPVPAQPVTSARSPTYMRPRWKVAKGLAARCLHVAETMPRCGTILAYLVNHVSCVIAVLSCVSWAMPSLRGHHRTLLLPKLRYALGLLPLQCGGV